MTQAFPLCQSSLQEPVKRLLELLHQEPSLRTQLDLTTIQGSLRKAISPTFEIVFADVFSAGKSMLINALLERELLYSEGHTTGMECQIVYPDPNQERVILTFFSTAQLYEQASALWVYFTHEAGLAALVKVLAALQGQVRQRSISPTEFNANSAASRHTLICLNLIQIARLNHPQNYSG